jgi:hypothetical protein
MDWVHLAQDKDPDGSWEHDNKPSISTKCWKVLE